MLRKLSKKKSCKLYIKSYKDVKVIIIDINKCKKKRLTLLAFTLVIFNI